MRSEITKSMDKCFLYGVGAGIFMAVVVSNLISIARPHKPQNCCDTCCQSKTGNTNTSRLEIGFNTETVTLYGQSNNVQSEIIKITH